MEHPVCNLHKKPEGNASIWPSNYLTVSIVITDQLTVCIYPNTMKYQIQRTDWHPMVFG